MNYLLYFFANNSASFIVGILTLIGAVLGVCLANYSNSKAENNRIKMETKAFLQAISTELNILWKVYEEEKGSIGKFLENNARFQEFIEIIIPSDIYFIIYRSNADSLGKIKNDELRKLIVSVYLRINEMCNSYKAYNNLPHLLQPNITSEQLEYYQKPYLEKLKNSHSDLKKEWGKFKKVIEKELKT
ncbi:MAG: hypothetical protein M0Z72_07490 [Deltaproteobacteria bacterium]|nr:hypothetical protein [Deltaproteobacteria bacterium]